MSISGRMFIDFLMRRMIPENLASEVVKDYSFTHLDGHDEAHAWGHIGHAGGIIAVSVGQQVDIERCKRILSRIIQIASHNGLKLKSCERYGQQAVRIELEAA